MIKPTTNADVNKPKNTSGEFVFRLSSMKSSNSFAAPGIIPLSVKFNKFIKNTKKNNNFGGIGRNSSVSPIVPIPNDITTLLFCLNNDTSLQCNFFVVNIKIILFNNDLVEGQQGKKKLLED